MQKTMQWGKVALKGNTNLELAIHDNKLLFALNNDILSFKLIEKESDIENVPLNRIIGKGRELSILPALPDRNLVLKPKTNLSILPDTSFKFYVYLPVTFQLLIGETKVFEHALKNLSSTWFGETHDGELCYALYTSFDTEISEEKIGSDYVICPIEIANHTKESLEVKRLVVRCIHLKTYTNDKLLITNKVKINYNGLETTSNVQFAKGATTSIPHLKQIAAPRVPEGNTIMKRSFQLIRHITQY